MSGRLILLLALVACSKHGRDKPEPAHPGPGPRGGAPTGGRPHEVACQSPRPPGNFTPGTAGMCKSDADCTDKPNGRCRIGGGEAGPLNMCTYNECEHDADCKGGGPCECADNGNYCLAGNCKTDAECGGLACARAESLDCRGQPGYWCRTAQDTCSGPDSCSKNKKCVFDAKQGHWACMDPLDCPPG
jgi:hypothetical protein